MTEGQICKCHKRWFMTSARRAAHEQLINKSRSEETRRKLSEASGEAEKEE